MHEFSPLMTHRLLLSIAGMLLSTALLGSCGDSVGNGAATDLVLIGGNGQAAIIDDTLPVPLSIRAVNQAGAGVAGVPVLWTAAAGGLVFADSITDPHGDAIATWVLGPIVGAQTATATVTGLNGSPLTFTATANPAANTLTWTSEQLPSGTYGGTWASSAADVFAVGAGGTIRHFNGSSWELQNSGTLNDLHGVWGRSSGDVFAAGSGGTVLHYDGANWGLVGNPPPASFGGIWASSPSDVFAGAGDPYSAGIWHYDGSVWTRQVRTQCGWGALWGTSARDIWAVGSGVMHYDGTTWSGSCSIELRWSGIWGSGSADVYSVGSDIAWDRCTRGGGCPYDGVIDRYDGAQWQHRLIVTGRTDFTSVWVASSGDAVVVGANGLILHYDGTRWRPESSGTTQSIIAVSGSSARDVWAITAGGLVLHGTR